MTLRERRELLGLTQKEVADRAGTTKEYYSQIETGRVVLPNIELRREISRALGIRHIDFLMAQGIIEDWEVPGFSADTPPPDPRLEQVETLLTQLDLGSDNRAATLSGILQLWVDQDRQRGTPPVSVRNGTR